MLLCNRDGRALTMLGFESTDRASTKQRLPVSSIPRLLQVRMSQMPTAQLPQTPRASIVVCTYDRLRTADLEACIASLLKQRHSEFEILVAVDHDEALYDGLARKFEHSRINVVLNASKNRGQASTMNCGVMNSRGEVICFIDDDAVADENWLAKLLGAYDDEVIAVGGRIEPIWMSKKPPYLPEELYWTIGCTGGYLAPGVVETRNLWSSNISYKATVFREIGLFSERLGTGSPMFQGEDAEFALRILEMTGKHTIYRHSALVYHKIRPERIRFRNLLARLYRQGYAKAHIRKVHKHPYALSVEREYFKRLLVSILRRQVRVLLGPERMHALQQLGFITVALTTVSVGFIIGLAKAKP